MKMQLRGAEIPLAGDSSSCYAPALTENRTKLTLDDLGFLRFLISILRPSFPRSLAKQLEKQEDVRPSAKQVRAFSRSHSTGGLLRRVELRRWWRRLKIADDYVCYRCMQADKHRT